MPSVLSTPPFSGRRPPFRLAEPSHSFGRPRLLRSPPSARNRHALTGSVAHGTPPKRPQTPDGTPAFGRPPFSPAVAVTPFRTPPALAAARRFPEPSHLNGARGPWFAAATTPNARRRPTFGRRLPFPLAGAASFRTAPALAAARRLLEPSHLNGGAWPMERCRDALKRPPATHLWPPPTFSSCRSRVLPHGPCSCRRPPFPLAGTARPFGQPRGRQIFHAGAGFCPYMQGFARACGILLI